VKVVEPRRHPLADLDPRHGDGDLRPERREDQKEEEEARKHGAPDWETQKTAVR